jgi:hypothetical protein
MDRDPLDKYENRVQRTPRPYQRPPKPPTCWQQTKQGAQMGLLSGLAIGVVMGTVGGLLGRQSFRQTVILAGQGAMGSGMFFMSIMSVGTAMRVCFWHFQD